MWAYRSRIGFGQGEKISKQVSIIQFIQSYYNQRNIYVKEMNGGRTNRTNSSKPVNINISFTINPKNILNQQSFGLDNQIKNKKISGSIQMHQSFDKNPNILKPKTPELSNTERVDLNKEVVLKPEDKKYKKSRKRNSVDQSYLNDFNKKMQPEKSINIYKQADSLHMRKSSTKSKKIQSSSIKRKHNKTYSKISAIEGITFKQSSNNLGSVDQKNKNFKSIINRLITNQLSKRSLTVSLPTQQQKTARKKKLRCKKQLKQGQSQYLIRKQEKQKQEPLTYDQINRKVLIQKLTSLRSMNNSIFKSEQDQQIRLKERRTIVINTDHSIDCIDQIHEIQKAAKGTKSKNKERAKQSEGQKVNETKNLIEQYIAILNQQSQQQYQMETGYEQQVNIYQQFQTYRRQIGEQDNPPSHNSRIHNQINHNKNNNANNKNTPHKQQDSPGCKYSIEEREHQYQKVVGKKQTKNKEQQSQRQKQKQRQKNSLIQFHSSQLTKQQKMINQIQRVKLNQLKKHEVEKWGQLLTFIKQSLKQGKSNHDQILNNIYYFLQQTKMDLQKQIVTSKSNHHGNHPNQCQSNEQRQSKDKLQQFTNKFPSNQLMTTNKKQNVQKQYVQMQKGKQRQFNQLSSMSFKDQDYQQENEQLKLMNLEMIQNALKSRHENLLEKRNKEISNLEDQRNNGLISQGQFVIQKQRIEKWTKKQTTQIMQARKNIWKGYNEAKGIIQKSLKSKHFQEQSAKKKSMMKCLSQDYLLKSYNYKKLMKNHVQEQSQSDQDQEEYQYQYNQIQRNTQRQKLKQRQLQKQKQKQKKSKDKYTKQYEEDEYQKSTTKKIKGKQTEPIAVSIQKQEKDVKTEKTNIKPRTQQAPTKKIEQKQQVFYTTPKNLSQEQAEQASQKQYSQQHSNDEKDHQQSQKQASQSQPQSEHQHSLKHDKQLKQLRQLGQFDDMNAIKQKLLNIKNKHLPQQEIQKQKYSNEYSGQDQADVDGSGQYNSDQQVSAQKQDKKLSKNSSDISYQQVDNQLHQSISDNQIKLINQQLHGQKQKSLPADALVQQKQQKLKHILPEDKQDIFQFIFLDLSIQLYQQPCHENKIMDTINNYVAYMKRQANKKKGVKTNLNVVKQYLKRFLGFILRAHKNVLKTLDEPVGPTAIQMLRYMHENDQQPVQGQQPPSPLVIPTTVFDLFQKTLLPSVQFETYYQNDQERQTKRLQFLKNILHIHNKALFDAMNQYLDLLRPFGIWGKPFPWKNSSSFFHLTTQQQKQQKLKKASEKVVEYCSYVCGLLIDKEESLVGNARLSEDYIQQIKEDRLSRMLATQLMENQERWLFYDDQQTEVLVQISNSIYVIMLRQATLQLSEVQKKKFIGVSQ